MISKRLPIGISSRLRCIGRQFVEYPSLTLDNFTRGLGKKKNDIAELKRLSQEVEETSSYSSRLKLAKVRKNDQKLNELGMYYQVNQQMNRHLLPPPYIFLRPSMILEQFKASPTIFRFLLLYKSYLFVGLLAFLGFAIFRLANPDSTAQSEKGTNVYFKDVRGIDEYREQLEEVVSFLKHPEKYKEAGATIPRGILLNGPPGTGKTLMAKAMASEAGVKFFYKSGSEFEEVYVGVGAARVRRLFKAARMNGPCIVFIDEIDAIASKRESSGMSNSCLNQLLTEMDGYFRVTKISSY